MQYFSSILPRQHSIQNTSNIKYAIFE